MANLQKRLLEWTNEGLISAEQAAGIIAFERKRPNGNWLLFGFMFLGAGVVGIGVISLVAANWSALSDSVKLGADLLVLLMIAYGVIHQQKKENSLAFELLLTFFALACLTSLGLIGQIYHAGGGWDQALLVWALFILPAMTLSNRPFLPFIWTTALLVAGSYRLIISPLLFTSDEERGFVIGYGLPLACGLVTVLLSTWPSARLFARSFQLHTWITGIGVVIMVDGSSMLIRQPWGWHGSMTWTGVLLGGALLAGIALHPHLPTRIKGFLGLMVVLYTAMAPIIISFGLSHWFSAFFTMALFALAAAYLVRERSLRLANGLILLLGLRFLALFLTAFGGLIDAGIGLIVSGSVILGFVWLWWRLHGPILRFLERVMP